MLLEFPCISYIWITSQSGFNLHLENFWYANIVVDLFAVRVPKDTILKKYCMFIVCWWFSIDDSTSLATSLLGWFVDDIRWPKHLQIWPDWYNIWWHIKCWRWKLVSSLWGRVAERAIERLVLFNVIESELTFTQKILIVYYKCQYTFCKVQHKET